MKHHITLREGDSISINRDALDALRALPDLGDLDGYLNRETHVYTIPTEFLAGCLEGSRSNGG